MTVQEKAHEILQYFTKDTRNDGKEFWKLQDPRDTQYTTTSHDEIQDMVHEAHGDMLPDDWKYAFVVEALNDIEESEDPDDHFSEPDIYTHSLLSWLASHLERSGYIDEAMQEMGFDPKSQSITDAIGWGQAREKEEVYSSILGSLREMLEEEE